MATIKEMICELGTEVGLVKKDVEQVVAGQNNHLEHHKKLYDRIFKVCLAMFIGGITVGGALLTAWILKG